MNINEAMEDAKKRTQETGRSHAVRNTEDKERGYYVMPSRYIPQNVWNARDKYIPGIEPVVCWFNAECFKGE